MVCISLWSLRPSRVFSIFNLTFLYNHHQERWSLRRTNLKNGFASVILVVNWRKKKKGKLEILSFEWGELQKAWLLAFASRQRFHCNSTASVQQISLEEPGFFSLWVCPLLSLQMFLSLHSPFSSLLMQVFPIVMFPPHTWPSASTFLLCSVLFWSSYNRWENLWCPFSSVRSRLATVSHTTTLLFPLHNGLLLLLPVLYFAVGVRAFIGWGIFYQSNSILLIL